MMNDKKKISLDHKKIEEALFKITKATAEVWKQLELVDGNYYINQSIMIPSYAHINFDGAYIEIQSSEGSLNC